MVSKTKTILIKQKKLFCSTPIHKNSAHLFKTSKKKKRKKRGWALSYKSGAMSLTYFHVQIPSVYRVVCAFSTHTCPRRTPQGRALTGRPADRHDLIHGSEKTALAALCLSVHPVEAMLSQKDMTEAFVIQYFL